MLGSIFHLPLSGSLLALLPPTQAVLIFFQLPLSGSPGGTSATVVTSPYNQLSTPSLGITRGGEARMSWRIIDLSTPSLGITTSTPRTTSCSRLPFNSLSRDHSANWERGASRRQSFNSLSRDHKLYVSKTALWLVSESFNSLSRDHRHEGIKVPIIVMNVNFQLPLSGSRGGAVCG